MKVLRVLAHWGGSAYSDGRSRLSRLWNRPVPFDLALIIGVLAVFGAALVGYQTGEAKYAPKPASYSAAGAMWPAEDHWDAGHTTHVIAKAGSPFKEFVFTAQKFDKVGWSCRGPYASLTGRYALTFDGHQSWSEQFLPGHRLQLEANTSDIAGFVLSTVYSDGVTPVVIGYPVTLPRNQHAGAINFTVNLLKAAPKAALPSSWTSVFACFKPGTIP